MVHISRFKFHLHQQVGGNMLPTFFLMTTKKASSYKIFVHTHQTKRCHVTDDRNLSIELHEKPTSDSSLFLFSTWPKLKTKLNNF